MNNALCHLEVRIHPSGLTSAPRGLADAPAARLTENIQKQTAGQCLMLFTELTSDDSTLENLLAILCRVLTRTRQ
jgi:hypothetical protein